VPELVALDVVQGPDLPTLLRSVWARGDAACVLDPRVGGAARDAQLAALRPTRRIRRDGVEVSEPDGLEVDDGDALVVATSGSIAVPRAVVLTHDAVAASARATSARLGVGSRDVWLCCLPCSHVGGLSVLTRSLYTDTKVSVLPTFDARAVDDELDHGATLVSLVATTLRRLARPERFRRVLLGGSAPPPDLPSNVVTTWGMTETGSGVVYDGVPLEGVAVVERAGELLVRGPMLARSYRDGAPVGEIGPDGSTGWFATGDAGDVTDGVVRVTGRIADVINTGGEKVWPDDVERALSSHPSVAHVAVWRRADDEWGQRVVAYVVPTGDVPTLDQLRRHVEGVLAPWAAPRELVIVSSLPRAASGKVVRRLLESSADPT
jgi:o-succinylbenzoate---CoA ligase